MALESIFLTRHRELRPPWRLLVFITLLLASSFALLAPLGIMGVRGDIVPPLLAALFSSWILTRWIHRKPLRAIGLSLHRSSLRELGIGSALGLAMMAAVFLVEIAAGLAAVRPSDTGGAAGVLGAGFVSFLIAASVEEVLFRGYLFQLLIQWITLLPAMLVMAVLFAFAHGGNPGVGTLAYLNIGLVSLTLSFAYYKTRGLWMPIGLHWGWNFAQTTLFGFPTSGLTPAGRSLLTLEQSGPAWITGGAFGPEGGLLATAVIVAATWFVVKSERVRGEEGIITLDSIEDLVGERRGE